MDLDAGLIGELRRLHVLYDRDDGGGSFLHCYAARRGRVFFEVVERRNGYAGYGAVNAPVRMAAQRQSAEAPTP